MRLEVILSPKLYEGRTLQRADATVAVDVLRASSAICAAFMAGAETIVPLGDLAEMERYGKIGYTMAAERNGEKVHGARCGNSPTEYLGMDLKGHRLAYSTTNGTVAIRTAAATAGSGEVFVGAFANVSALAHRLREAESVVVLCSGWKGEPSLEDTLMGGALAERLEAEGATVELVNDGAMMARALWKGCAGDPWSCCAGATHVARLERLGCAADIAWAMRLDSCSVVPQLEEGYLVGK